MRELRKTIALQPAIVGTLLKLLSVTLKFWLEATTPSREWLHQWRIHCSTLYIYCCISLQRMFTCSSSPQPPWWQHESSALSSRETLSHFGKGCRSTPSSYINRYGHPDEGEGTPCCGRGSKCPRSSGSWSISACSLSATTPGSRANIFQKLKMTELKKIK